MSWALKVALIPAVLVLVLADFPLDINFSNVLRDDEDLSIYRLSQQILPTNYVMEITPHFASSDDGADFTFDGIVTIDVNVLDSGLSHIVFHENVLNIVSVSVMDYTGASVPLDAFNPIERLSQYHFLRINLAENVYLINGQDYKIQVTYLGNIHETPLSRGVFRGSYRDANNNTRWYAATHFQPTNARQAFPCFDEPSFKAVFNLIINRPNTFTESFSNTPIAETQNVGNRVKEIFYATPTMSSYLVTFHISEEFTAIADNNDADRSYRILARPNAQGQGEWALQVGVGVTAWLEDFTGISYYNMSGNIQKNDQISSPDWASGAMENWGLVSYRELRLLYEEGQTNALDHMYIATITAHELAHKWFGNLVTCEWWDNIWINEGFASYFEYFATAGVFPEMELEDQFNLMYLQSSLSSDSSVATPPLNNPNVFTPEQVTAHFGTITYAKGASLLRMLEHLVTPSTFKAALNRFLVDRSYTYALPEHMYAAFEWAVNQDNSLSDFPDVDIADFFQTWIDEAGYPVLNVDINMVTGVMQLSQERFFLSSTAAATDQVWPLPLTYTVGSNSDWNQTRPTYVMTESTDVITKPAGHEWVVFNVMQTAHYRVNYDDHSWEMLAAALRNNHENIHYLNRAQIVDDVFALMRSERLTFERGFDVLSYLSEETNYYAWYPAISGFTWLRNRLLHLPNQLALFDEYLKGSLDAVITDIGYTEGTNENLVSQLRRFFVLDFACRIGHEGCLSNAVEQFQTVLDGQSLNPNIRRHVYCVGVRETGDEGYNRLHSLRSTSNNQADEVVLLRAMGCVTEPAAIEAYLEYVLSTDVRTQDRVNAFTFLFLGNRDNAKLALDFIKTHHDRIRDAVIGSVRFNTVISNLAAYLDEEGLEEMEAWLTEEQASIPEYAVGVSSIQSARTNMAWGTQHAERFIRAARGSASTASACLLMVTLASALVVLN